MTTAADIFYGTSGPRDAEVLLVGEAWGQDELLAQKPFVGKSGMLLDRILDEAGIPRRTVLCSNVVAGRPPGNDFAYYFGSKKEDQLLNGVYCRPELVEGVRRLHNLVQTVRPKLIIGCGNIPLWALTDKATIRTNFPGGIGKWRGSQLRSTTGWGNMRPAFLPIYHPAAAMREYSYKYTIVHDLKARARRFLDGQLTWDAPETNDVHNPKHTYVVEQLRRWLDLASQPSPLWLSVDIETHDRRSIACIGIADGYARNNLALCVPFFNFEGGNVKHYFTEGDEFEIIQLLRALLSHPGVRIIGQNFIYDHQWLFRRLFCTAPVAFDTMLAHHLLWPGTPKALHYLASLYCDHYVYWKDESEDWADTDLGAEDLWKYNCKDTRITFEVAHELKQLLAAEGMQEQFQFQLDQWEIAASATLRGFRADESERRRQRDYLRVQLDALDTSLLNMVPSDLQLAKGGGPWYNSPAACKDLFYTYCGLAPILHKKTGRATSNAESFDALRKQAPWLSPLLDKLEDVRTANVMLNGPLSARLFLGRHQFNFNVGGTDTFRWSSRSNGFGEGTNAQNVTKGHEED